PRSPEATRLLEAAVDHGVVERVRRLLVQELGARVRQAHVKALAAPHLDVRAQGVVVLGGDRGIAPYDERVVTADRAVDVLGLLADPRRQRAVVEAGRDLDVELDPTPLALDAAQYLRVPGLAARRSRHGEEVRHPHTPAGRV